MVFEDRKFGSDWTTGNGNYDILLVALDQMTESVGSLSFYR